MTVLNFLSFFFLQAFFLLISLAFLSSEGSPLLPSDKMEEAETLSAADARYKIQQRRDSLLFGECPSRNLEELLRARGNARQASVPFVSQDGRRRVQKISGMFFFVGNELFLGASTSTVAASA